MFSLENILLTITILIVLAIFANGIQLLAEDGITSLLDIPTKKYSLGKNISMLIDLISSWVVVISAIAILCVGALGVVYGLTHLDEVAQNREHQGETYQCLRYETKVTTRKRIISLTDTYDTYEEEYCAEYGWVKNEE